MAAGKGGRMHPFSEQVPKPLIPVCNTPLIEYQIKAMRSIGITDIILVVGHLSFEIAKRLGDGSSLGVSIKYVEQIEILGLAHALAKVEPYISSPFLVFLGDIFFVSKNLESMIRQMDRSKASAVLAVIQEKNPELIRRNFAVFLDTDGRVKRVIEKPRYVTNNLKGCGIYLFDPHIFDAIRRTPRSAMRDEYELTDSIQILIEDGFRVEVADVIETDINLTKPKDIISCNLKQLELLKKNYIVGEDAYVENSNITNSVIGDNAYIKNAISISNSVIFPETIVDKKIDLNYCIVTKERIIDCKNEFY